MPGIASLEQYLLRMTKNQLIDGRRKRAVEQKHLNELAASRPQEQVTEDEYTLKEYLAVAEDAINRLPEKQKKVFLLRHRQDYTLDQIAAATGSSWEAVHKNLVRAVSTIKKELQQNSKMFSVLLLFLMNAKK
jgi:RNA polymerase sigma-70 factor (ECF subfamily)